MNDAGNLWFDPAQTVVLVAVGLFAALAVLQFRLISRTGGPLRWLAAAPSLIIAAFVLLNIIAPSNIWPIALAFWTVIAFAVHAVVWFLVRLLRRPV